MGTAGFRYRGGCTDNDWNSANCAVQCKQVAVGSFSNIYPCPEHPGSYPVATDWCCGATEGTAAGQAGCCNTSNSKVDTTRGFGPFFIRDYNRTEPVSSSTATTTVTSSIAGSSTTPLAAAANTQTQTPAPATTPLRPSSTKRDVAIGLGVGVPIAVLALALLGFLLLREHRRRTHAEKTAHDIMEAKRQSGSDASLAHAGMLNPPGIFGANGQRVMPELSSDPISLNELQSRPIYEAGS
ncbi:MAG: hypothetical protein LQ346_002123 [Caloplaca aetnensis]|nr:MAG: hypothetical protein LQ346_002123 [Caloplaca aetnensis]